jgi:hypothetical protein
MRLQHPQNLPSITVINTSEETVVYLKKNISAAERNSGLLEKAFDNYSKNQTGMI